LVKLRRTENFVPNLWAPCIRAYTHAHRLLIVTQMYWLGPLVGGLIAGLLYDLVFAANASIAKTKAFFTRKDYDESQFDENQQPSGKVGDAWS